MSIFPFFITGDVGEEHIRHNSSAISVSSGESDYSGSGRVAPTPFNSNIDRRILYHHGTQINTPDVDWGFHGYNVNAQQHRPNSPLCEEIKMDSDENGSSNYTDSPNSNGFLRIKRKHLRRRFLSSPDTGNDIQNGGMKREPLSEPNFGIQSGSSNVSGYQYIAKNVGEKVVQKYRRRASNDVGDALPPGLKGMEAPINVKLSSKPVDGNAERRQSLPAKMPRKLRPIYPRGKPIDSGHNSDSSNEDRKGFDPENPKWPHELTSRRDSLPHRPVILVSDDSDKAMITHQMCLEGTVSTSLILCYKLSQLKKKQKEIQNPSDPSG